MAVAIQMDFKGATLDQYDQVLQKMGLSRQGQGPSGALFHWVVQTADGIRVVDVWRDRETFERFSHEQIEPITREVGFTDPPAVQFFEVHNYLTAG